MKFKHKHNISIIDDDNTIDASAKSLNGVFIITLTS